MLLQTPRCEELRFPSLHSTFYILNRFSVHLQTDPYSQEQSLLCVWNPVPCYKERKDICYLLDITPFKDGLYHETKNNSRLI